MNVSWLLPAGAVASVAIIAIVVLHMRHRMPGVVPFPQLAFWPRVPSESRDSPRWRRPPVTLLFLLQLIAALLLVLGFMRPALPGIDAFGTQRTSAMQHVVVVDGSTSMLAVSDTGASHWDMARQEVDRVLDTWQQGDGITLVVAAPVSEWRSAADQRQVDDLRQWFDTLGPPGGIPDAAAVSSILADVALPDLDQQVTLITDGGLTLPAGSSGNVVIAGAGRSEAGGNVAITSTLITPLDGGGHQIEATVIQTRSGVETLPWIARDGATDLDSGTLTLASGETARLSVRVPEAVEGAMIEIVADDQLPEDNRAYVNFAKGGLTGLRVVLVSDVSGPTRRALQVLPGVTVEVFPSTTPGIRDIAANADLVVYEASAPRPDDMPDVPMILIQPTGLDEAWQVGGVVPNPSVSEVELNDPVMRDISLDGIVFGETPIYSLDSNAIVLASGSDGEIQAPLIWRGNLNGHSYVAYAFDPSRSSIADRVTFPVLIAQTVFSLAGSGSGRSYEPGDVVSIDTSPEAVSVRVEPPVGDGFAVPVMETGDGASRASFSVNAQPGSWTLVVLDATGRELERGQVTVNIGNDLESRLDNEQAQELRFTDPAAASADVTSGDDESLSELWPLLVLGAFVVIALEWLVWIVRSAGRRQVRGVQTS